jgi:hypothetical protein
MLLIPSVVGFAMTELDPVALAHAGKVSKDTKCAPFVIGAVFHSSGTTSAAAQLLVVQAATAINAQAETRTVLLPNLNKQFFIIHTLHTIAWLTINKNLN